MKTPASFLRSAAVAIAFLAACLSAGSLRLDAVEKPSPNRPGVAPGPASATAPEYTLEIVNGKLSLAQPKTHGTLSKRSVTGEGASVATLINIVDLLRDLHPEANIAMSPELANVKIADLKLRATSLDDELEALRVASGDKFIWLRPGTMPAVDPTTGLAMAPAPSQTSLYSVMRVFETDEAFWGWLKVVARSAARDGGRKHRRYFNLLQNFALGWQNHAPERTFIEDTHLGAILEESLDELDPQDRRLIEGKYLDGETVKELSAQTGLTDKAVESRLGRLRRRVREMMIKKLHSP